MAQGADRKIDGLLASPHAIQFARGFTLLELILTLLILSVLSVTALPKFIDFGSDARKAVAGNTLSSFKTSALMLRTKWLVAGQPKSLSIENGATLYFNAQGWPVSQSGQSKDANGWALIAGNNGNCVAIFSSLLSGASVIDKTSVDIGAAKATDYDWCARAGSIGGEAANAEQCNFVQSGAFGSCYPSSPSFWINYNPVTGTVSRGNF